MYAKPYTITHAFWCENQRLIAELIRTKTKIKLAIFRRSCFNSTGIFPRIGANILNTKRATDSMQGDQACNDWRNK